MNLDLLCEGEDDLARWECAMAEVLVDDYTVCSLLETFYQIQKVLRPVYCESVCEFYDECQDLG